MSRLIVVSDSGPLIALGGCGHLPLLTALFDAVHVPQAVVVEVTTDRSRPGAIEISAFIEAHAQVHPDRDEPSFIAGTLPLDAGEAQALNLAHALRAAVLIDERRGRQVAIAHGLPLVGVMGVLLQARRMGLIERVAPVLDRMQSNGYRISQTLIDDVLRLASETR